MTRSRRLIPPRARHGVMFVAVLVVVATAGCSARSNIAAPSAHIYASGQLSLLVEPDRGIEPVYALIASARHQIDLTMYELVDTKALLALELAASHGVAVRVVLDGNRERTTNQPAHDELAAMGVSVEWADARYAATHQKTLVIDRAVAAVMSLNLTTRYYPGTRDFAILDRDASDVAAIEQVFDADFRHASISPSVGNGLVWSPGRSQSALLSLIDSATVSLLIENEEMADKPVTAALIKAARRGVRVVVVMTDQPQWHTAFNTLRAAHVDVRVYPATAALYIHAKAIVSDGGTAAQRVFVGSENFSSASLNRNRELGLLTTDPMIVASVNTTINADAAGAESWHG